MKALVAMSGGVDSSVAAALLVERGYDVVGVTLKQWQEPDGSMPEAGCCTVADAEDARRVGASLGIRYYVLDYVAEFTAAVVEPFGRAYLDGRTPNPCVECNRRVRFRALLDRAAELGCDVLATGHHARVVHSGGRWRLLRGNDESKDQSYVLHMLGQEDLARTLLPIGEMTKDEVRSHARRLGLRTADKPDSQDICFVGRGSYRDFLRRRFPASVRPGPILDVSGEVVGRHDGVAGFTIGQRKGLGLASAEPRYVVAVDAGTATVTIGNRGDLLSPGCDLGDVSFVSGEPPEDRAVEAKIRYRSAAFAAILEPSSDGWSLRFRDPQPAVAPGQAAVFYAGDEVLGGGSILRAHTVTS